MLLDLCRASPGETPPRRSGRQRRRCRIAPRVCRRSFPSLLAVLQPSGSFSNEGCVRFQRDSCHGSSLPRLGQDLGLDTRGNSCLSRAPGLRLAVPLCSDQARAPVWARSWSTAWVQPHSASGHPAPRGPRWALRPSRAGCELGTGLAERSQICFKMRSCTPPRRQQHQCPQ